MALLSLSSLQSFLAGDLLDLPAGTLLDPDTNLLADGLLDSLGVVRLVAFLEADRRLTIPPEDVTLENFHSLRAIADYLARRQPPP